MRKRFYKTAAMLCGGILLGIFPGCVEVYLLNIATPFLLNQ
ncbi:MAG: hypothetical protein ACE5E6_05245 [Phycisphaerae bacterium]